MSEFINNSTQRVNKLKELILKLHEGVTVEETRKELTEAMAAVPYGEVVRAEEELIAGGLPKEEILKFCDIHTDALKGKIDTSAAKSVPDGHPVHTFIKENDEIIKTTAKIRSIVNEIKGKEDTADASDEMMQMRTLFNSLMDVEKHYLRKENLVFPFLEKYNITGPPMVMWGKHDEIRSFLKSSMQIFESSPNPSIEELNGYIEFMFEPTLKAIEEMIYKEEKILFPMCLDALTEIDWYEIYQQSDEIGFTLYFPQAEWKPTELSDIDLKKPDTKKIKLPTGSFTPEELEGIFNSLPFDLTFVDKEDNVRFFSHGEERIFQRNKAILGRKVQYCHPPSSVHIVNQILDDFKSGKQSSAKFWINFRGMYVLIAYYAVRNERNKYLGTLEVTQDIAPLKKIEGERRLLTYDN
jgi:DUF438 domain-containing protein